MKKKGVFMPRGGKLEFCSIASGSSGNSYMIRSDESALVVDVGISGKRIKEGLLHAGCEPENVEGILITHEHSDHIKSIRIMQKHCPFAKIYSSIGTWEYIKDDVDEERQITVEAGSPFVIRDIEIKPFTLSHDARDPIGYSFEKGDSKVSIVTDTGIVTEEIQKEIAGSSLLVLESNHDEEVLMMGSYPYEIKRRILSEHGHLSNEAAAKCICQVLRDVKEKSVGKMQKVPQILLAHLSKENNSPDMAMITIKNALTEAGIYEECGIVAEELNIEVLDRKENSRVYKL